MNPYDFSWWPFPPSPMETMEPIESMQPWKPRYVRQSRWRKQRGWGLGSALLGIFIFFLFLWLLGSMFKKSSTNYYTTNNNSRPVKNPAPVQGAAGVGPNASFPDIVQSFYNSGNLTSEMRQVLSYDNLNNWKLAPSQPGQPGQSTTRIFVTPRAGTPDCYWDITFNPATNGWTLADPRWGGGWGHNGYSHNNYSHYGNWNNWHNWNHGYDNWNHGYDNWNHGYNNWNHDGRWGGYGGYGYNHHYGYY